MTADHSKAMLLILGAITGSACLDQGPCTTSVEPAIRVEVRDAATGAFIADIARGVARDGDFEDSLRVIGATGGNPSIGTTLGGADERPGTYAIHLEAEGYARWDRADVRVTADGCHVRTVELSAALEPSP